MSGNGMSGNGMSGNGMKGSGMIGKDLNNLLENIDNLKNQIKNIKAKSGNGTTSRTLSRNNEPNTTMNNTENFKDYNKGDTQKLILESCLFGCLFYIVSHRKFSDLIKKVVGKMSKDNIDLVLMFVFLVLYYLINYLV